MDKIRIKYDDANGEPMWISKIWYSEDNVSSMWTTDPDLAKVWDLHITTLGRILAAILQAVSNENPVNSPLTMTSHNLYFTNLLSILKKCRVERVQRTTHYKVIQTL